MGSQKYINSNTNAPGYACRTETEIIIVRSMNKTCRLEVKRKLNESWTNFEVCTESY